MHHVLAVAGRNLSGVAGLGEQLYFYSLGNIL